MIPRDKGTLAAAGATLVVLTAGWFGLLAPTLAEHAGLVAQTQQADASSQEMGRKLPALRSELDDIAPRVDSLRELGQRVPSTIDQSALLRQLEDLAAASGIPSVRLTNVGLPTMVESPAAVVPDAIATAAPGADLPSASDTEESTSGKGEPELPTSPAASAALASYEVTMEVAGSEPQVRDFLAGLQSGERLALVNTSALQVLEDGTATLQLKATFFLQQVDVEGLASQIEDLLARGTADSAVARQPQPTHAAD
ncbi:hypothetical protein [Cellulomonas hominis]|nr:hypothetical protein [Cellulomonas hominis]